MIRRALRSGLRHLGPIVLCAAPWTAVHAADVAEPTIVVTGRPRPIDAAVVPDAALAGMRGGLMLPNGLNLSIGFDIQTRVDGLLALHTIYSSDGPDAGIRVFTDGAGSVPTAPGTLTVTTDGDAPTPSTTVARAPTGTTVSVAVPNMPATLNILSGAPSTWIAGTGETAVPVTANGPGVATAAGNVRLSTDAGGSAVILDAPGLEVRQLVGRATGVVIANASSDRVIDTVSSINLDLRGLSPELAAGFALSDGLALAIATGR